MNILRFMSRMRFLGPRRRLEWYPPFWLMRVRVLELADDWSQARLCLPLTAFSRNMGDAMFGGYQAAVADPIAALACVYRFPGYAVWTRAMTIDFMREGNSDLELRFVFDPALAKRIGEELAETGRSNPQFEYSFFRTDGKQCTHILNTVAIRPKDYLGR